MPWFLGQLSCYLELMQGKFLRHLNGAAHCDYLLGLRLWHLRELACLRPVLQSMMRRLGARLDFLKLRRRGFLFHYRFPRFQGRLWIIIIIIVISRRPRRRNESASRCLLHRSHSRLAPTVLFDLGGVLERSL